MKKIEHSGNFAAQNLYVCTRFRKTAVRQSHAHYGARFHEQQCPGEDSKPF